MEKNKQKRTSDMDFLFFSQYERRYAVNVILTVGEGYWCVCASANDALVYVFVMWIG